MYIKLMMMKMLIKIQYLFHREFVVAYNMIGKGVKYKVKV